MENLKSEVSCSNVFKHTEVETLKTEFTQKWVDIIKLTEKNKGYVQGGKNQDEDNQ